MNIDERMAICAMLSDLENHNDPNTAALATDLRGLLEQRPLPPMNCLIVWTLVFERQTTVWSVQLNHGEELNALHAAHGEELHEDDPIIETLRAAVDERGRELEHVTEAHWLVGVVTTL